MMWRLTLDTFEEGRTRRRPLYRSRLNPTKNYRDYDFFERYRLTKEYFNDFLDIIREDLEPQNGKGLSPDLQFSVALRFFAEGGYMKPIGDLHGISRFSAARCIHRVSRVIGCHEVEFIEWSFNDDRLQELKKNFYDYSSVEDRHIRMPGVLGAIDGTHIRIATPVKNESIFVNRKNYHSINTQLVCDSNLRILSVNCKWPGSTHDAFILRNSDVWDVFEENENPPKGWLLGDQGYMLKPWLLTPINTPNTPAENQYNRAHKRARCVIERCNGVLKARFRCLGGILQFSPRKSKQIIKACVCLHNFAISRNTTLPESAIISAMSEDNFDSYPQELSDSEGRVIRDMVIQRYFQ